MNRFLWQMMPDPICFAMLIKLIEVIAASDKEMKKKNEWKKGRKKRKQQCQTGWMDR